MTDADSGGPLDVHTLEVLGQRASSHPVVESWSFQPDAMSPRRLELRLDDAQYPERVEEARLDVRWFEGGQYTIHYLETGEEGRWQCRWDRHPKPDGPTAHFHPPPDAAENLEPSIVADSHHLEVLFTILGWIAERIEQSHAT